MPMTKQVEPVLADYLQQGRPETAAREVFVLHGLRVGAPISTSIVGRAVQRAVEVTGIDAPVRGGNLLRHSLATELLAGGASLPEIDDVLGHACLATTRIYAAVDIGRLREVPLRWPQTGASHDRGNVRRCGRCNDSLCGGVHRAASRTGFSLTDPRAFTARVRPAPGP